MDLLALHSFINPKIYQFNNFSRNRRLQSFPRILVTRYTLSSFNFVFHRKTTIEEPQKGDCGLKDSLFITLLV